MKDNAITKLETLTTSGKKELIKRAKKFSKNYCVGDGQKFKLKDYKTKPSVDLGAEDKPLVIFTAADGSPLGRT